MTQELNTSPILLIDHLDGNALRSSTLMMLLVLAFLKLYLYKIREVLFSKSDALMPQEQKHQTRIYVHAKHKH